MDADNMNLDNEIFKVIKGERGGVANIHSAFSDFLQGVEAHYQFYQKIMLASDLPLSRSDREQLAWLTSQSNQCPYCIHHHQEAYKNTLDESVDAKKNQVLEELAQTLTKEPWKASQLKAEFCSLGFSEAEWQHAVMVVSYFNLANRCAFAMDLDLEEGFEKTCL